MGRGGGGRAGPLLGLLVIAGICTARGPRGERVLRPARCGRRPTGRGRRRGRADAARLRAVRTLLSARAGALLSHDRAGWLAGVDPAASAFRARQAALLTGIAAVPLGTWRYTIEPGDEAGRTEAGGGWTVRVTLHYALRDADPAPTERPLVLTFVPRAGRWLARRRRPARPGRRDDLARALGARPAAWSGPAPPASCSRTRTTPAGWPSSPRPRTRWCRGSGPRSGAGCPDRVAVIVPDDEREMAALVGEKLVLGTIAAVAVADTVDTERDRALGQRIVVNPANIDRLGQLGRRVVLEHEVTHLATRGFTGSRTPIWLVEGLADWVAYRDSGLPAHQVADQLHAALGAGHWPGRLPGHGRLQGRVAPAGAGVRGGLEGLPADRRAGRAGRAAAALPGGRHRGGPGGGAGRAAARAAARGTAQFTVQWRHSVQAEFR